MGICSLRAPAGLHPSTGVPHITRYTVRWKGGNPETLSSRVPLGLHPSTRLKPRPPYHQVHSEVETRKPGNPVLQSPPGTSFRHIPLKLSLFFLLFKVLNRGEDYRVLTLTGMQHSTYEDSQIQGFRVSRFPPHRVPSDAWVRDAILFSTSLCETLRYRVSGFPGFHLTVYLVMPG
jgi:hypothetical protein